MAVALKSEPVLVRPAGSHWLELGHSKKEELYPILEVEAPRVGLVRCTFSVDKYESSSGWTDWRIYLRDVRTPDPGRPDLPHLGRDAVGVGDATRRAISEACIPVIREWLETDEYQGSRERAAASYMVRQLEVPAAYKIEGGRRELEKVSGDLALGDYVALRDALEQLEKAREIIDAMRG